MTEPIVIDGCNVAECVHHYTNLVDGITYHGCSIYEQTNELGYQQDTICEQNPDCYFKQLQRLKQENEGLKKYIGGFVYNCRYCDEWYMDKCNYLKKENKYKQTLEEIREKCLKMCNICDNIDGETYLDDCNSICEYCKIVKLISEGLND